MGATLSTVSRFRRRSPTATLCSPTSLRPHVWEYPCVLGRNFDLGLTRAMASKCKDEAAGGGFKPLYVTIEDMESFERYRPGGYHLAQIGDRLRNRYHIIHKLGFGSYSTTWLARDEEAAHYVAVKISVAEAERPPESEILRLLGRTESRLEPCPGKAIIPLVLDEFDIKGPNGTHRCLVTAPARMSIAESREASNMRIFQLPVARAIAAQLVQAITFMHSQGVVHSDLHEGNILLRLPKPIDSLTPEQLYERYGEPELEPVKRLDSQPLGEGVPSDGVVPIWLGDASENLTLPESRALLTDFGESFQPAETPRYNSHTPYVLRPPELFFLPSTPLSFSADIWGLACAIFAILGQRPLFEAWFPSNDRVIEEHVDTLGHPPPDWWARWTNHGEIYNEQLERKDGLPRRPLAARFEYSIQEPRRGCGMAVVEEDEKASLSALLLSMLAFEPEDRPSVQQVLESDWMARWALPDLDRARCSSAA